MPRTLIAEDDTTRTYEVTDAEGHVIGTDIERKLVGEFANEVAIRDAAKTALVNNRAYVAISAPTAAQTAAQVKALTRQMNGVIRLVLNLFDGND